MWTLNFWIAILFVFVASGFWGNGSVYITGWTHQVSFNLKTCVEVPCIQNHKEDRIADYIKVRSIKFFSAVFSLYPMIHVLCIWTVSGFGNAVFLLMQFFFLSSTLQMCFDRSCYELLNCLWSHCALKNGY